MALSRSDLEALSATSIDDELAADEVRAALASPPFVPAGILNLRDLGQVPGSRLRPGRVFRSATLKDGDAATAAWLSQNVTKVFDLRHDREIQRAPDPAVPGVENVRREMAGKVQRMDVQAFAVGDGAAAWRDQYLSILELYAPTLRAILEHVRDSDAPFLFHCTAGRDRTGVVAGMLHHLGGTPDADVVYDYMLSRVGLEPARDMLVLAIKAGFSADDQQSPGFHNVCSVRPSFWAAFREGLADTYGGWDGYIRHLGFTETDLETMRSNLRAA